MDFIKQFFADGTFVKALQTLLGVLIIYVFPLIKPAFNSFLEAQVLKHKGHKDEILSKLVYGLVLAEEDNVTKTGQQKKAEVLAQTQDFINKTPIKYQVTDVGLQSLVQRMYAQMVKEGLHKKSVSKEVTTTTTFIEPVK